MIGIFDSGVGGLTVVKEVLKELPDYQIIYFGDTARLPYGTKGAEFVRRYSEKIVNYLVENGAEIIIIACHTASSWAGDFLKNKFSVPVFDMITPGIQEAAAISKNKKIGIIGTPGTIRSGIWKKKILKIDSDLKVYSKSCPLLVSLIEEGWISKKATKEAIEEYLKSLKLKKIDVLILACTHYPLLEKEIRKFFGENVRIVNPAVFLAKEIKQFLVNDPETARKIQKGRKHQFFFSDKPYNLTKISKFCFREKINLVVRDPFL